MRSTVVEKTYTILPARYWLQISWHLEYSVISILIDEKKVLWELCDSSLGNQSRFFRRDSLTTHCVPGPVLDARVAEVLEIFAPVLGTLGIHGEHKGDNIYPVTPRQWEKC